MHCPIDINYLIKLSAHRTTFIQTTHLDGIELHELENCRWLYHQHYQTIISLIDLSTPYQLNTDYQKAMLCGLNSTVKRVLNLGMGAGGFERWFNHYYPDTMVDSVELSEEMINLSKTHFKLPAHTQPHQTDAESFLIRTIEENSTYDNILCDICQSHIMPSCLADVAFYQHLKCCLTNKGIVALNLLPDLTEDDNSALLNVLVAARCVFSTSMLIDIPNCKNIVLILAQTKFDAHSFINNSDLNTQLRLEIETLLTFAQVLP